MSELISFTAIDNTFNLGVKPYTDRELISMKHRSDEKQTGTYVTFSAFQQGIGTGSYGPWTLDEHCYNIRKDYTIKFLITRG